MSRLLLVSASALLFATTFGCADSCEGDTSATDGNEAPNESSASGGAPEVEPVDTRPPLEPTPVPAASSEHADACGTVGAIRDTEDDIVLRLSQVFDEAGNPIIEYATTPGTVRTVVRNFDDRGLQTLEVLTSEARPRVEGRRTDNYDEQGRVLRRNDYSARTGRDFRVAYRYEADQRLGDYDVNFTGVAVGTINATLNEHGDPLTDIADTDGNGISERRVDIEYDANNRPTTVDVYLAASETPTQITETAYDPFGNETLSSVRFGEDEPVVNHNASLYTCHEGWGATCDANAQMGIESFLHQACAARVATQAFAPAIDANLSTVDRLMEPTRGLTLITITPEIYAVDNQPLADAAAVVARLLELAAEVDRETRPDVSYAFAVAPQTPSGRVVELLHLMDEGRARRNLFLMNTTATLSFGAHGDALLAGVPVPDDTVPPIDPAAPDTPDDSAAPTGPVDDWAALDTALTTVDCPAIDAPLQRLRTGDMRAECPGAITEITQALVACGCPGLDNPADPVVAALARAIIPDQTQTAWSVRLNREFPPIRVGVDQPWSESLAILLEIDPNRVWFEIRE